MTRPGIQPLHRIRRGNAAADLESAGPCGERLAGGLVVSRAEFDHMAAGDLVAAEGLGEPGGSFV